jgi:hypothetical protein
MSDDEKHKLTRFPLGYFACGRIGWRSAIATLSLGALFSTIVLQASSQPLRVAADLSLAVLRLPSDVDSRNRTLLWAAVQNRTDDARLICVGAGPTLI